MTAAAASTRNSLRPDIFFFLVILFIVSSLIRWEDKGVS